jgi:hypothetical protein
MLIRASKDTIKMRGNLFFICEDERSLTSLLRDRGVDGGVGYGETSSSGFITILFWVVCMSGKPISNVYCRVSKYDIKSVFRILRDCSGATKMPADAVEKCLDLVLNMRFNSFDIAQILDKVL